MRQCSICKTFLKSKSLYMELIAMDSGIVRSFCPKCVKKMYSNLLLKPVKNRDEINLMVYYHNFLRKVKEKIES